MVPLRSRLQADRATSLTESSSIQAVAETAVREDSLI
jgi:hypothetical protein